MLVEVRSKDVACSSGVGEQLFDGYFRSEVFVRVVGQVVAEGRFEIEFAVLHELHSRNGSKDLVHGADAETRLQSVWRFLFAICETVRLSENSLAGSGDHGRPRKKSGGHILLQFLS